MAKITGIELLNLLKDNGVQVIFQTCDSFQSKAWEVGAISDAFLIKDGRAVTLSKLQDQIYANAVLEVDLRDIYEELGYKTELIGHSGLMSRNHYTPIFNEEGYPVQPVKAALVNYIEGVGDNLSDQIFEFYDIKTIESPKRSRYSSDSDPIKWGLEMDRISLAEKAREILKCRRNSAGKDQLEKSSVNPYFSLIWTDEFRKKEYTSIPGWRLIFFWVNKKTERDHTKCVWHKEFCVFLREGVTLPKYVELPGLPQEVKGHFIGKGGAQIKELSSKLGTIIKLK